MLSICVSMFSIHLMWYLCCWCCCCSSSSIFSVRQHLDKTNGEHATAWGTFNFTIHPILIVGAFIQHHNHIVLFEFQLIVVVCITIVQCSTSAPLSNLHIFGEYNFREKNCFKQWNTDYSPIFFQHCEGIDDTYITVAFTCIILSWTSFTRR